VSEHLVAHGGADASHPSTDASGMNPEQRAAVEHAGGPLVVFAGAGSGKTRVITHRIAHLVQRGNVPPYRILAVTFTNKAAGEMRARLQRLVGDAARDLWVGTFHAICAKLLRRYHEECGVKRDFVIYDDSDQKAMLTRVVRDEKLDEKRYAPKFIAGRINSAKQEGKGPEQLNASDPFERRIIDLYRIYEERMRACGALDFGDLIYRLVVGMRESPVLLAELRHRFQHVLVDEFQDTNHVQYELVRLLAVEHQQLCVVGDDDQSIYRWRGADRRNILDFRRAFPGATIIKLEQNYRSTKRILRVANAVVSRNVDREPKSLWTENDDGSPIVVMVCDDERDEAYAVVRAIRELLSSGESLSDIALLYRIHAQSRVFEEALRAANLAYRVFGGTRFYDRAEVKDVLAYLRVLHNPDDDVSLLRIINTPTRGIGKTTIDQLLDIAAVRGVSVWSVVMAARTLELGTAARKKLGQFADMMTALVHSKEADPRPSHLTQQILDRTGYTDSLKLEDTAEADARVENLDELLGSMQEFEKDAEEPTLAAFLELVTLQTDADRSNSDQMLTLMTVHAAKGLEFPSVFVAGLEEELFPRRGFAFDDDPDELEEERRLAYVAFTRAERTLVVTHAHTRRVHGELKIRRRSRFIDEMPQTELRVLGKAVARPATRSWQADPYAEIPRRPSHAAEFVPPTAGSSYVDRSDSQDATDGELRPGIQVVHRTYGIGKVQAVDQSSPPKVTVSFPGWGRKTILATFLEPA